MVVPATTAAAAAAAAAASSPTVIPTATIAPIPLAAVGPTTGVQFAFSGTGTALPSSINDNASGGIICAGSMGCLAQPLQPPQPSSPTPPHQQQLMSPAPPMPPDEVIITVQVFFAGRAAHSPAQVRYSLALLSCSPLPSRKVYHYKKTAVTYLFFLSTAELLLCLCVSETCLLQEIELLSSRHTLADLKDMIRCLYDKPEIYMPSSWERIAGTEHAHTNASLVSPNLRRPSSYM